MIFTRFVIGLLSLLFFLLGGLSIGIDPSGGNAILSFGFGGLLMGVGGIMAQLEKKKE